ncbi:hypothetical protein HY524_00380 [Candidatus Berkelbacteria bacterium]|nr:hypothetical protein [Candidatus Berkelbacteria bacterium]
MLRWPNEEINQAMETTLEWVMGICLLLIIALLPDYGWMQGQITAYPVYCNQALENDICSGKGRALEHTQTFKVDRNRQLVVEWTNKYWYGWGKSDIQRFTECAIADRSDWTCKADDRSQEFGFEGGHFHATDLKSKSVDNPNDPLDLLQELKKQTFYVSRLSYIQRKYLGRDLIQELVGNFGLGKSSETINSSTKNPKIPVGRFEVEELRQRYGY